MDEADQAGAETGSPVSGWTVRRRRARPRATAFDGVAHHIVLDAVGHRPRGQGGAHVAHPGPARAAPCKAVGEDAGERGVADAVRGEGGGSSVRMEAIRAL